MSDTPRMEGWWQASDGKWYPPEQHPNYQPLPPTQSQRPPPSPTQTTSFEPLRQEDGRFKRGWRKFRGLPTWAQVAAWIVLGVIVIAAASGGSKDKARTAAADLPVTTFRPVPTIDAALPTLPPATSPPVTTRATSAPTTAPPTTPAPATTLAGPKTTFGPGTYRVGVDIAPGTYVAPGGTGCYWERQSVFGGGFDAIIANEASSGGQVVVTVSASDKGFKTSGCGTWRPG